MAKTYLDQIVEYPYKVMTRISQDATCVGLLLNKSFDSVTEDDMDTALDENIKDYQYVDDTTQEMTAYVLVEMEVNKVDNKTIKGIRLYVTVACYKGYMALDRKIFKGVMGNRRDNLVRYIDKLLNNSKDFGFGLKLKSVLTLSSVNGFAMRQLTYEVPEFNIVEIDE